MRFLLGIAVSIFFAAPLSAGPLPFRDGRYVTDKALCGLSDEQLARFGDQVAVMVRDIHGSRLTNAYEMECEIGSVQLRGREVRFAAVCASEGEASRINGRYRMISASAFVLGDRTFSLCAAREAKEAAGREATSIISGEPKWAASIPKFVLARLSALYNRTYVEMFNSNIDWNAPPFKIALVPLQENAPDHLAIIVQWLGSGYCGSAGCAFDIWLPDDEHPGNVMNVLGDTLELGSTFHNGFRDLWIDDNRHRWNGRRYERN